MSWSFSEIMSALHAAARKAILAMPSELRGPLSNSEKYQQTHFYAWLRGNDHALAWSHIDGILQTSGLRFRSYAAKIICSARVEARKHKLRGGRSKFAKSAKISAWKLVDWKKSNKEIAAALDMHPTTVASMRRKLARRTVISPGKRLRPESKWARVDYSRPTKEIAAEHGVSAHMVYSMRCKFSKKDQ